MKRLALFLFVLAACGDNDGPPIQYYDPPKGGKLRLVENLAASSSKSIVLDLVVGDQPLTGYSVGFDLPLDDTRVSLASFTPLNALDPGSDPVAAKAVLSPDGPLAHELVAGLSQKADGTGAVTTDTTVQPGAKLFTLELDVLHGGKSGVVFDGTASGFVLPSGGMRDRAGSSVVDPQDVAIGKLVVRH